MGVSYTIKKERYFLNTTHEEHKDDMAHILTVEKDLWMVLELYLEYKL